MLPVPIAAALLVLGGQDPKVPAAPELELPVSRHAVVPRTPVEAEDVLEVDADGAFRVDGKRFVGAATSDRRALESLEAWLASVARGMPPARGDKGGYENPETGTWLDVVRDGTLRVRADRDAPWSRVLMILSGCTDRQVGILRLQLGVRDARAPEDKGWLELRLPELTGTERFTFGGQVIGFDRTGAGTSIVGSYRRVELEVRVRIDEESGERQLDYQLGPRRYESLRAMKTPAGALFLEEPTRPFTITTTGALRWHEMVAVLDLLRDAGVEQPVFVAPGESPR